MVEISDRVKSVVEKGDVENGAVLVFAPCSTGALASIEDEPGLVEDFKALLKKLIPEGNYKHDRIDKNARSHLRASLLKSCIVLPIVDREIVHGTWQQLFFVELDIRPRKRQVFVQLLSGK